MLYTKDWAKCPKCGCLRPERALKDGVCLEEDWCAKASARLTPSTSPQRKRSRSRRSGE
jgi:hypothetical protein